jgi:hypothetical protein
MRRALAALMVLVAGCGEMIPPSGESATVTTPSATVLVGGTVALSGSVNGGASWSVNNVGGGNARFGTITAAGVYTAPQIVPTGNPVSIRIVSATNPADSARVELIVVPTTNATGEWVAWQPRIINAARTDSFALVVSVLPTITRVELSPPTGPALSFRHLTGQLYQVDLPAAAVTSGYVTGDYHKFVGFIDYYEGDVRTKRGNGFASVRDATMPDAPAISLASDAIATTRVLNLREDNVPEAGVLEVTATQRLYQLLPDQFDFVAVVQPVTFYQNRFYLGVRNNTTGIGVLTFDIGATYGSANKLQGVIHYPIDGFFDLGENAANHEIGHRWINHLSATPLSIGIPHWPVSTLASGVMGISGAGGVGGNYNRSFVSNGNGTYTVVAAADTGTFNDLELYLMGMIPKIDVGPHIVFANQTFFPVGATTTGATTTVTVDDIIAVVGVRSPPSGATQTTFRVATVVLSSGRLLSDDELAFFHHMASRGEATERLRYTSGFGSGMSRPFFVATGGRGQLTTTIR